MKREYINDKSSEYILLEWGIYILPDRLWIQKSWSRKELMKEMVVVRERGFEVSVPVSGGKEVEVSNILKKFPVILYTKQLLVKKEGKDYTFEDLEKFILELKFKERVDESI